LDLFRRRLQLAADRFATDPTRGQKTAINAVILLLRVEFGLFGDTINTNPVK
jgi:hypothetical protein